MQYNRVLPRDAFNESKLLKGIGRISLLIHDNVGFIGKKLNCVLENESQGFKILMDEQDGSTYCSNFYLFDNNGTPIYLSNPLNCKLPYPLQFEYKDTSDFLFTDEGELSPEFINLLD